MSNGSNPSSNNILKKFSQNTPDSSNGLKLLILGGILVLIAGIYFVFRKVNSDKVKMSESSIEKPGVIKRRPSPPVISNPEIPKEIPAPIPDEITLKISAKSLSDLGDKIKLSTASYMYSNNYTPYDFYIDVKRKYFTCKLKEAPSDFTKLVFAFGVYDPSNWTYECESCTNVMIKNPGSQIMSSKRSGNMVYKIIAIQE